MPTIAPKPANKTAARGAAADKAARHIGETHGNERQRRTAPAAGTTGYGKRASKSAAARTRMVPCDNCGGQEFQSRFAKRSSRGETFQLVSCRKCSLLQVNPQPNLSAVQDYYENHYFLNRTDRGYADYYSPTVRKTILDTYDKNLKDLNFYLHESRLRQSTARPRALDAGCAAGYFVDYLRRRGWNAEGIELSAEAARFGKEVLELPIQVGDYLASKDLIAQSYDLISFWASIEHMHSPRRVLARTHSLLRPGGHMLLSTCRYGLLAKLQGARWRYMNVPEHLYFFSLGGLRDLAADVGFRTVGAITYGSGMTTRKNGSLLYNTAKRILDPLVKTTGQGDMMALLLEKA